MKYLHAYFKGLESTNMDFVWKINLNIFRCLIKFLSAYVLPKEMSKQLIHSYPLCRLLIKKRGPLKHQKRIPIY